MYTLTSRSCRGFQGGNVRPTIRGGDSLSFLYSICRRSVPSILPGKWNNQSTNIYKLYTIIPATLKQLQIDFSLAAFDVLYDRIVCTIATFDSRTVSSLCGNKHDAMAIIYFTSKWNFLL